jgi:hypothetical protein
MSFFLAHFSLLASWDAFPLRAIELKEANEAEERMKMRYEK